MLLMSSIWRSGIPGEPLSLSNSSSAFSSIGLSSSSASSSIGLSSSSSAASSWTTLSPAFPTSSSLTGIFLLNAWKS